MKLIVAVDSKWGIGKNNDLLFHLKADMRHFVEHTKGKTVIMGANTLRSFPNGMPLKGRTNIVLNPDGTQEDASEKGYILATSLENLFEILNGYDTSDAYVIGGAMMYHTMLPYCEEAIITKVDADGGASVFFDNLDELNNWTCISKSEPIDDMGYTIRFCTYKNETPLNYQKVDKFYNDDTYQAPPAKKVHDNRGDNETMSPEEIKAVSQKEWYKYCCIGAIILLIIAVVISAISLIKFATLERTLTLDNASKYVDIDTRCMRPNSYGTYAKDIGVSANTKYIIEDFHIIFTYETKQGITKTIEMSSSSLTDTYVNRFETNLDPFDYINKVTIIEVSGVIKYGR